MGWYDRKVRRVRDLSCGDTRIFLEMEVRRLDCRHYGKVSCARARIIGLQKRFRGAFTCWWVDTGLAGWGARDAVCVGTL
jgi:hypothetical protein